MPASLGGFLAAAVAVMAGAVIAGAVMAGAAIAGASVGVAHRALQRSRRLGLQQDAVLDGALS